MKFQLIKIIPLGFLIFCAGCGSPNGFSTSSTNPTTNTPPSGGNGGAGGGGGGSSVIDQVRDLDLNGYVAQGSATDRQNPVISFDVMNKEFIIRIPLQLTGQFTVGQGQFPGLSDIKFATVLDNNGFNFVIRIPMKYILRKVQTAAPGRLPNGDPLPAVPSGELPQVNLVLNPTKKEKVYLYLSKEYFAVLFESKFNHGADLSAEIRDKSGLRVVGYFHMIKAKNNSAAAFMIAGQLPPKVTSLLDQYLDESPTN